MTLKWIALARQRLVVEEADSHTTSVSTSKSYQAVHVFFMWSKIAAGMGSVFVWPTRA